MSERAFRIGAAILIAIICVATVVIAWAVWPGQGGVGTQAVGEAWDQSNREVTLLSSSGRVTTTNASTQTNYWHRGLTLFVDVTGRDGSTTLTPNLQVQEPVGDNWITVWTLGRFASRKVIAEGVYTIQVKDENMTLLATAPIALADVEKPQEERTEWAQVLISE